MRIIRVQKVVVNIGVGEAGENLEKAEKVLGMLTKRTPVRTLSKTTNREWGIRAGMPIGCRVTLRGQDADDFIVKAFWVKENRIANYSFDQEGNFSFGIPDYTDFEGMRYDPQIGILGMDVCVTLTRPGKRIALRNISPRKLPPKQRITKDEGISFVVNKFKVEVMT
ncbi:MAG: 50S ribosomal protein L5 [Candidatus Thermoplasmatota archaeon]|nr:50S ribosomal protein L5 [Euryarchaeota archaeon]MBU4031933.1 50S ribosomal protein L5 [Candidatus Thermoplasmatota archaeon]MBU4072475.1 50S ribosomal protein L5 [Candidatus Thermoplasmatota archaeon]MBU4144173.1 50S ribosomal protein L5 [Candidatus Thermoplasmatota archaeon]MBU4592807.1 50S ribosomal protein L5 [Candidatus Thermoplasmatota archaeon]